MMSHASAIPVTRSRPSAARLDGRSRLADSPGMSTTIDPLLLAGAKAKGRRPWFIDPDSERLMNILLVTIQELAVTRERLDTVERLLDRAGVIRQGDIEAFAPTRPEAEARGAWMQEYLARVFRILQQDREALQARTEQSSEDVAEELARR